MSINVLEIRNYLLQPDMREHFIDYFEANFIHTLEAENMHVLGQFRLIGEPDHFVWLRGYTDMQSRGVSLPAFYDGPVWQKHRTLTNSMIIDSDNVHLLRPLDFGVDLTCGQTATTVAAALAESTLSLNTGVIAVDFYQAIPKALNILTDIFRTDIAALYRNEGVQLRGVFAAEMSQNTFPRHPAIQNRHELVVITAYENESTARTQRARLAPIITQTCGKFLDTVSESLLLNPTLRSPLRYFQLE